MVATGVMVNKRGWVIAVNDNNEEDWECPKCGGQLRSCCGNSHIKCYECGFELWEMFQMGIEVKEGGT